MASEIKVDTISGKTSANGVTIDGLKVKDGVITQGKPILVADQWRLTADLVGSNGDITANLEQIDTAGQATIGDAMTESSGIFTFPHTGIYHVVMSCRIFSGSDTFTSVTMSVTLIILHIQKLQEMEMEMQVQVVVLI